MEIWAKSKTKSDQVISLEKHTEDILQAVVELHKVMTNLPIDEYPAEWWRILKLAAFFHDVGKIDPEFQYMVKNRGYTIRRGESLSHNMLSLFLLDFKHILLDEKDKAILMSAIVFHHWRDYYVDLMMGIRTDDFNKKANELWKNRDEWLKLLENAKDKLRGLAKQYEIDIDVVAFNDILVRYFLSADQRTAEDRRNNTLLDSGLIMPPYSLSLLPQRLRQPWDVEQEKMRIFVTGNLMRCDHFVSMCEEEEFEGKNKKEIEYQGEYPDFEQVAEYLESQHKDGWQKRFFANHHDLRNESMILIAPTGVGKTEFSYLWGAGSKNVFLLPMQAAVNSIHERTEKMFKAVMADKISNEKKYVSLLHGGAVAAMWHKEQEAKSKEQGEELFETRAGQMLKLARSFVNPYIVATADQAAPAALRYPGYERTYAVLMNSVLVIDEVQAYDPKAAAIITFLLENTVFLGGRILLMTATLPPFIRKEITRRLHLRDNQIVNLMDEEIPQLEVLRTAKLHCVQLRPCIQQENDKANYAKLAQEMLKHAYDSKRVLVIFNTVKKAQAFFEVVKNMNVENQNIDLCLFHSRFTVNDKKSIETKVVNEIMPNKTERSGRGCIIVSTQVVEASLNIDADLLYTELCPIDSLLQRMGRVMRRYVHTDSPMPVSEPNVTVLIHWSKESNRRLQNNTSHRIYDKQLILTTLLMLLAQATGIEKDDKQLKDFALKKMSTLFHDIDKKSDAILRVLHEGYNKSFILDATQKEELVEDVYRTLEEINSGYLVEYYKMLETLQYGYCADKRQDAQKLFRDVSNIEVIPLYKKEDFIKKIQEWHSGNRATYLSFTNVVLDHVLVSVPQTILWRYKDRQNMIDKGLALKCIRGIIQDEAVIERMQKWIENIYFMDCKYNSVEGLSLLEDDESGATTKPSVGGNIF